MARRSPTPRAPAPRRRLDVDDRRDRLLALGITIFSERAYDAVSIDDIARSAGIAKGLLYHYFPTKHSFYVAALRAAARQLLDETLDRDRTAAPAEQIRQAVRTYFQFVARRGAAYVTLMRGGVGSDEEVAEVLEKTRATFVARIIEALPDAVPGAAGGPLLRAAIRGWVGFVEAMCIDWVRRRTVPVEQLAELAQSVLLDAIRSATQLSASHTTPRHRKAGAKRQ